MLQALQLCCLHPQGSEGRRVLTLPQPHFSGVLRVRDWVLSLRSGFLLIAAATAVEGECDAASWGSLPGNLLGFPSPGLIKQRWVHVK